jgi:fused-like protein
MVQNKDKLKQEFLSGISENLFDDILLDILSNTSYKNDISPKGILALLNIIIDLIDKKTDYKILFKKIVREHYLRLLIGIIKQKQIQAILDWPGYRKEESSTVSQNILIATLKIIKLATEVSSITEDIIKSDFLSNIRNIFDYIQREFYHIPISIIYNLLNGRNNNDDIVNNISIDFFIQYPNIKFIEKYYLLKEYHNSDMIIEILLILSSLCRPSQNVYSSIHELNIYQDLKYLIENSDSSIKARVCNLIGNMCRHTDFFYDEIKNQGIIPALLKCCYDSDRNTRKFACFAIGNAAFLNNKLYDYFRPVISRMVDLLQDPETNTRANSAGALGNFVRCGDALCIDIISAKAPEALLRLAETEDIPSQIQIIKVALFALGNFCYHQSIKNELEKFNFRIRIEELKKKFKNEGQLLEHLERIKKKLKE